MNTLSQEEQLTGVVSKLKAIDEYVRTKTTVRVAVTCSDVAASQANTEQLQSMITSTGLAPQTTNPLHTDAQFKPQYAQKHWVSLPFATNFAAKSIRTVPYTDPSSMALQVLASLMKHHYLHREIREKNGAYGGGAVYSGLDGVLSFYSYRDPNPEMSCSTFDQAATWATRESFSSQQLKEAKLSILSSMDAPVSVANEGMALFQHGITDEIRQQRRDTLFAVNAEDVRRAAEFVVSELPQANTTIIAGESLKQPITGWTRFQMDQ
jgi:Zn-dependent M16 (insulinase) family peptidase